MSGNGVPQDADPGFLSSLDSALKSINSIIDEASSIADKVTGAFSRSAVVQVFNLTALTLNFVTSHHESGGFGKVPKDQIDPKSGDAFESETKGVATGAIGSVTYVSDEGSINNMLCGWNNPEAGSNAVNVLLDGPRSGRFGLVAIAGSGNHSAIMRFTLYPKREPFGLRQFLPTGFTGSFRKFQPAVRSVRAFMKV